MRFETLRYGLAEDDFTGPTTRFVRAAPLSVDPALLPTMPVEHWEELKARLRAAHAAVAPSESRSLVAGLVLAILVTVVACIAISAV